MAAASTRRFTIMDAIVLIATTAFGLALCREVLPNVVSPNSTGVLPGGKSTELQLTRATVFLQLMMIPWMTGVFVLLLLNRPKFSRLIRHPGPNAMFVALACGLPLAILNSSGTILSFFRFYHSQPLYQRQALSNFYAFESAVSVRGMVVAIVASWLTLWVSRLGRRNENWLEQLGSFLAYVLIGLMLLTVIRETFNQATFTIAIPATATPPPRSLPPVP